MTKGEKLLLQSLYLAWHVRKAREGAALSSAVRSLSEQHQNQSCSLTGQDHMRPAAWCTLFQGVPAKPDAVQAVPFVAHAHIDLYPYEFFCSGTSLTDGKQRHDRFDLT